LKIQLLTFPGCPNAAPAREALREAMALEQVKTEIEEIDVTSEHAPEWATCWGSPTILVDGADVADGAPSLEPSCRLYQGGAPSIAQICARLATARGARR